MIHLGLLGLGTVGQGIYEIICSKKEDFFNENNISIKKILEKDTSKQQKFGIDPDVMTDNIDEILSDNDISIILSVLGGFEPEYSFIKRALKSGKHVITANKEIISKHADELLALAKENNVMLLFEASVGGGIPIIGSLIEICKINKVSQIQGILNGTTNYILTKMAKENRDFEDVLKEAQQKGFAEADPTADIKGFDILRKITILASIAFKTVIQEKDVHIRGIHNITLQDIQMAEHYGYKIKYIAQAILKDGKYSISVTPALLKKNSVISNVNEEYNIILVNGNIIGELCFMGKGAGKDATANAMVSDMLKIINGDNAYEHIQFGGNAESGGLEGVINEYYIRISTADYKEFSKTVNLIADSVNKNKIIYSRGKLFVLTENISAIEMQKLNHNLLKVSSDVFYARLENNLL